MKNETFKHDFLLPNSVVIIILIIIRMAIRISCLDKTIKDVFDSLSALLIEIWPLLQGISCGGVVMAK